MEQRKRFSSVRRLLILACLIAIFALSNGVLAVNARCAVQTAKRLMGERAEISRRALIMTNASVVGPVAMQPAEVAVRQTVAQTDFTAICIAIPAFGNSNRCDRMPRIGAFR